MAVAGVLERVGVFPGREDTQNKPLLADKVVFLEVLQIGPFRRAEGGRFFSPAREYDGYAQEVVSEACSHNKNNRIAQKRIGQCPKKSPQCKKT